MSQHQRIWMSALIAMVMAIGAWVSSSRHEPDALGTSPSTRPWWSSPMPHEAPAPDARAPHQGPTPEKPPVTLSPLDTVQPPDFRANAQGHLIIDSQARTDVERVHALYGSNDGQKKLDAFCAHLPDTARQELRDLYRQWVQYGQAVMQAFPPESSSDSLEEAKRQLASLKQLRQQYFGPERAKAMFGEEEEISEDLLRRIEANKDPRMSFDDKVNQAQEGVAGSH